VMLRGLGAVLFLICSVHSVAGSVCPSALGPAPVAMVLAPSGTGTLKLHFNAHANATICVSSPATVSPSVLPALNITGPTSTSRSVTVNVNGFVGLGAITVEIFETTAECPGLRSSIPFFVDPSSQTQASVSTTDCTSPSATVLLNSQGTQQLPTVNLKTKAPSNFSCGIGSALISGVCEVSSATCNVPTTPLNTLKDCSGLVGSTCTYSCPAGFTGATGSPPTCQGDGSWSGSFMTSCALPAGNILALDASNSASLNLGSAGAVVTWTDTSPTGRVFTVQAGTPTLTTLNGFPGVQFQNLDSLVHDGTSGGVWEFYFVWESINGMVAHGSSDPTKHLYEGRAFKINGNSAGTVGWAMAWRTGTAGFPGVKIIAEGVTWGDQSTNCCDSTSDRARKVFRMYRSGTIARLYQGETLLSTVDSAGLSGTLFQLGADNLHGSHGRLMELLGWNSQLSATLRGNMIAHLRSKWGAT